MAPRKTVAAKPVKMPSTSKPEAVSGEFCNLTAKLKKMKKELACGKAEENQLVRKHENKKAAYARESDRRSSEMEAFSKKHEKTMKKLRTETAKAKQELDEMRLFPIEDNVEQKLGEEEGKKSRFKEKMLRFKAQVLAAGKRSVEEAVQANGGEPLNWQCCTICCERFDQERKPKVLSCGHTFCLACCRGLRNTRGMLCPMDRTTTEVFYADDLCTNHVVSDLCL